jgi:hypothetical protein
MARQDEGGGEWVAMALQVGWERGVDGVARVVGWPLKVQW